MTTLSPGGARGVADTFREAYGAEPSGVWAAPGRVNLIGEHVDYNAGLVLPWALPRGVALAARPAAGGVSRLRSRQRPADVVTWSAGTVAPGDVDGWGAYAAGVVWALRDAGHDVPDLDLLLDGDVPAGAGLSSSAALECAVALALDDLTGLGLDRMSLARLAQRAENVMVGTPCGIMDQVASLFGRAGHLVLLDVRDTSVDLVPLPLAEAGLTLLVLDTRAPHALVDGEYAARRSSCEEAARILGVASLRELTVADLPATLARLDDVAARRVRHVVTEIDRVGRVVATLRSGAEPRTIGPELVASHASMRDDFEITVPHVDVAVEAALEAGAHGARMTGGGFGGSVIALCDSDGDSAVVRAVGDAYAARGWAPPGLIEAPCSPGARRIL